MGTEITGRVPRRYSGVLSPEDIQRYQDDGYLIIEDFFDGQELQALREEMLRLLESKGPEVFTEPGNPNEVRLFFGSNRNSAVYDALSRDERVLGIARTLVDTDIYIHQLRVNPKGASGGEAWAWHQDYAAWRKQDGIESPQALIFGILLDDATAANGPLVIIPRSHREGFIDGDTVEGGAGKYATTGIPRETIRRLSDENGLLPVLGKAGAVVITHPNMIHASPNNITPYRRTMIYIIYNSVGNPPRKSGRPDFLCNRDVTALQSYPQKTLRGFLQSQS